LNAHRLFAEFQRLSDAPDAVTRLRRFVLDLAVALISRPFGGTRVPTLLATVNAGRVATFTVRSPWLLTC